MNPLAGYLVRQASAGLAQSALPNAPVHPHRPRRRTRLRFRRR